VDAEAPDFPGSLGRVLASLPPQALVVTGNTAREYQHVARPLLDRGVNVFHFDYRMTAVPGEDTELEVFHDDEVCLGDEVAGALLRAVTEGKRCFVGRRVGDDELIVPFDINKRRRSVRPGAIVLIPPGGRGHLMDFTLQRIVEILRSRGRRAIVVGIENRRGLAGLRAAYPLAAAVHEEADIPSLIDRVASLDYECVFYRGWMHDYALGGLLALLFENVVVSIKDWNFSSRKTYAFFFGEKAEDDFRGIDAIFRRSKKVVSHYTAAEASRWAREYGVEKNRFVFLPEFSTVLDLEVPSDRDDMALVWAGTVPPSSFPAPYYIGKDMYRLVVDLGRQGVRVAFVVPEGYYERMKKEKYLDFFYEHAFNPNFEMIKGRNLDPRCIERFGYGIFPLYIGEATRLTEYAVPSKLAFYLEANLPLIVNAKMRALSEIVSGEGIGIVVDDGDVATLGSILKEKQRVYADYVENVCRFKNEFYARFSGVLLEMLTAGFHA